MIEVVENKETGGFTLVILAKPKSGDNWMYEVTLRYGDDAKPTQRIMSFQDKIEIGPCTGPTVYAKVTAKTKGKVIEYPGNSFFFDLSAFSLLISLARWCRSLDPRFRNS